MIRRVLSQPGSSALYMVGLPPGTPTHAPLRMVWTDPAGTRMFLASADPLAGIGTGPVAQVGNGSWGRVVPAGRL